jgi:catechol 2,3-dioxygenase-like lactoylglutathione lyase family enzyme
LGIVVELDQTEESMLHSAKLVAFAATRDFERAKAFYGGVLGLQLVSEDPFALVFDASGTALRISKVAEVTVAPYTVLGWDVSDITATVRALTNAGVRLERFPGIPQDELGIWTSPGGSRVAWFKDPEGNLLSVSGS